MGQITGPLNPTGRPPTYRSTVGTCTVYTVTYLFAHDAGCRGEAHWLFLLFCSGNNGYELRWWKGGLLLVLHRPPSNVRFEASADKNGKKLLAFPILSSRGCSAFKTAGKSSLKATQVLTVVSRAKRVHECVVYIDMIWLSLSNTISCILTFGSTSIYEHIYSGRIIIQYYGNRTSIIHIIVYGTPLRKTLLN